MDGKLNALFKCFAELVTWLFYNVILTGMPIFAVALYYRFFFQSQFEIDLWGGDYALLAASITVNTLSFLSEHNDIGTEKSRNVIKALVWVSWMLCILFYFTMFNSGLSNPILARLLRENKDSAKAFFYITMLVIVVCVTVIIFYEIAISVKRYKNDSPDGETDKKL